jgi:hypothetical protein|tara:strand:- start:112 stop:315 length:204 start_codon:yes stop_codon:yes gene_type:complete
MPAKSKTGDVKESSYVKIPKIDGATKMSKGDFKPHKMYCKDGSTHNAKTYKEHMALKKKGCGHTKKK